MLPELTAADMIQLGALGLLYILLFLLIRYGVPKMFDLITAQQKTFTDSLDKITARHEASMKDVSASINGMSGEITGVREAVAACKYRQGGK